MTVEKPKPKQLLRPITTGADSAMNQSQFREITCNSLKAREKSRVRGAIGFGFASHWLKNWRESFKPITTRSNRNHVITFDGHLKTALFIKLKHAKVITIFKGDDETDPSNYRPISLLSLFNHQQFEKVMYNRLKFYVVCTMTRRVFVRMRQLSMQL